MATDDNNRGPNDANSDRIEVVSDEIPGEIPQPTVISISPSESRRKERRYVISLIFFNFKLY